MSEYGLDFTPDDGVCKVCPAVARDGAVYCEKHNSIALAPEMQNPISHGGPRVSSGKDSVQEVGAPRAFLDAVEARFGKFAWDLAANESNHVTTGWFGPGSMHGEDSLTKRWWTLAGLCWLNPPYAGLAVWAKKRGRSAWIAARNRCADRSPRAGLSRNQLVRGVRRWAGARAVLASPADLCRPQGPLSERPHAGRVRRETRLRMLEVETMSTYELVNEMCHARGLKPEDVRGSSRLSEFVRARVAIAARLRDEGCSYPEIGRALGNKHHTTAMYWLRAVRKPQLWKYLVHLTLRTGRAKCGVVAGDGLRSTLESEITCPSCVEQP